jgi:glutamate-5-semialdehyde dehydrogenase
MTNVAEQEVVGKARRARAAAAALASASSAAKDAALKAVAEALASHVSDILKANAADVQSARKAGSPAAFIDRLLLNEKRIREMADGIGDVIALPDPVGQVIDGWKRPNGLEIRKVRVPLGVVGIIYESRPNVTADAAALCLKAGNAVILRGGSEALESNKALVRVIRSALASAGLPEDAVQLVETTDRAAAQQMMKLNGLIDVLIPRGGAGLIRSVIENATVPVIETGVGNCHVYVDSAVDLGMAQEIAFNAKCQRPGVCNAMETLLVHQGVAQEFLPAMSERLMQAGVEIRGCERTRKLVPAAKGATEEDWETEYLGLILAVKVVDSLDEAIAHINRYGTMHSEAIITKDYDAARKFCEQVDAAAVYVNASTRFTDGYQYGLGAEIGISTQKLHARGPMGLEELTTYKWVVFGDGQVRT